MRTGSMKHVLHENLELLATGEETMECCNSRTSHIRFFGLGFSSSLLSLSTVPWFSCPASSLPPRVAFSAILPTCSDIVLSLASKSSALAPWPPAPTLTEGAGMSSENVGMPAFPLAVDVYDKLAAIFPLACSSALQGPLAPTAPAAVDIPLARSCRPRSEVV